jgi:hypothetical protein
LKPSEFRCDTHGVRPEYLIRGKLLGSWDCIRPPPPVRKN